MIHTNNSFGRLSAPFLTLVSLFLMIQVFAQETQEPSSDDNTKNKPLTKAQIHFVHHDKVKDPLGKSKHVSSPYIQLYANTTYYLLVAFSTSKSQIALYKRTGKPNADCFSNECWEMMKKYASSDKINSIKDTLFFSKNVDMLLTSWPMGFSENSSCEVVPTTQGEGVKFTFKSETNNTVRIAKSQLKLL
jgi:hypothetical protein